MKSYIKLPILTVITLLVSVVLTKLVSSFIDFPLDRIFRRVALLVGLIIFIGYFKKIEKRTIRSLGFEKHIGYWKNYKIGILTGIVISVIVGILHYVIKIDVWPTEYTALRAIKSMLGFVPAAMLIGFLEEGFFRGYVYRSFSKDIGIWPAAILTSAIYAILHFVKYWEHFQLMLPDMVGLFFFGLILTYAYHKTGSLWFSAGLHASLAWCVKESKYLMILVPDTEQLKWLIGNDKLFNGLLGWAFFFILPFIIKKLIKKHTLITKNPV